MITGSLKLRGIICWKTVSSTKVSTEIKDTETPNIDLNNRFDVFVLSFAHKKTTIRSQPANCGRFSM